MVFVFFEIDGKIDKDLIYLVNNKKEAEKLIKEFPDSLLKEIYEFCDVKEIKIKCTNIDPQNDFNILRECKMPKIDTEEVFDRR